MIAMSLRRPSRVVPISLSRSTSKTFSAETLERWGIEAQHPVARAGAFVSIDSSGALRTERGYVRPKDKPPVPKSEPETRPSDAIGAIAAEGAGREVGSSAVQKAPEEDESVTPIPDRLLTELTAYRTLALHLPCATRLCRSRTWRSSLRSMRSQAFLPGVRVLPRDRH